jgi:Ca2+-binding RTX toxin-like protein
VDRYGRRRPGLRRPGNDTLNSGEGNDLLVGEGGDDTINAAGGNDTVQSSGYAAGFDAITGGAGMDRVVATAANTAIGLSSLASVEEVSAEPLVGSGPHAAVIIRGSEVANTLTSPP